MTEKIYSLYQMQDMLLADSTPDDLRPLMNNGRVPQTPDRTMTAEQVRREISLAARTLVNGYCGWPFHEDSMKYQVMKILLNIYTKARDMTAGEFFNKLRPALEIIPDGHLSIELNDEKIRSKDKPKYKDVGKNIASRQDTLKLGKHKDIAVIAISTLNMRSMAKMFGAEQKFGEDWRKEIEDYKNWNELLEIWEKMFREIIDGSSALIIDLRGNGGGTSTPTDRLADYLYGSETQSLLKSYIRATPEGKILQKSKGWNVDKKEEKDPAIRNDNTNNPQPAFDPGKGYAKPIYILTDIGVGSSAEMFIARLYKKHPHVKLVGDNTGGMEVFGDMSKPIVLPHSKIDISVGQIYRMMEPYGFEELKGFPPDIRCEEGQDAFDIAIQDFNKNEMNKAAIMMRKKQNE